MKNLAAKVAVVTGAGQGIGFGIAHAFLEEGMRVVLADIDEAGPTRAVAALQASGSEVIGVHTDVSKPDQILRLRDTAFERFGTVHVLCSNAAVGGSGSFCEPIDLAVWDRLTAVNLYPILHGLNAFLPRMIEQGEGHVVNTSSNQGLIPTPILGAYPPLKAAMISVSEMLKRSWFSGSCRSALRCSFPREYAQKAFLPELRRS